MIEKRLIHGDRKAGALLTLAVGAGFVSVLALALNAWLLSRAVDQVFLKDQNLGDILPLLGAMLALLMVRAAGLAVEESLAQRSASRVKAGLQAALLDRLQALGPVRARRMHSGEWAAVLVEGLETLDAYLTQFLPARYLAVLAPALIFLIILALDSWTTLILLFAGPFLLLLLAVIGGKAKALTERRFLEMKWMSAFFLDILSGIATLKIFGRSREQAGNIETISRHYGNATLEILTSAFQTSLVMEWAAVAATAMAALEISLRLMNGSLAFERGLAALLLVPEFFLPIRQMALRYHAGTAGKAAATSIFNLLDEPEIKQSAFSGQQSVGSLTADRLTTVSLTADRLTYTYPASGHPAVQELSFVLEPGSTTAMVGHTGAGKSTVASLLMGFIAPDSGSISLGGREIGSIDRAVWLKQIAWTPQDPTLFYGTVAENIRLAKPDASQEEIEAAARAANAHEFIAALPQGYDTPLGEGGWRLSGGERQRIAIARAVLKDAPLLVLDEYTAHLDAHNEALVQAALEALMRGRTTLVIAHRLHLVYAAGQVLMLEQGRLAARGTHAALLAESEPYRLLVQAYQDGTL